MVDRLQTFWIDYKRLDRLPNVRGGERNIRYKRDQPLPPQHIGPHKVYIVLPLDVHQKRVQLYMQFIIMKN